MPILLLILDIDTAGLAADVVLNGVPILEERTLTPMRRAIKINGWVIEGNNLLEVRLIAPREAGPVSRFTLSLRRAAPGPETAGDETLLQYTWSSAEQPLKVGESVLVLSRQLSLHAAKTWSWQQAQALPQLGQQDRDAIAALLRSVEAALSSKNAAAVVDQQRLALTEQAEALGEDPSGILNAYRSFLTERMSEPNWHVLPIAADALDFTSLAGGRLVHVRTRAGQPPLVARTTDSQFLIDPYVAKVAGRWTIVR